MNCSDNIEDEVTCQQFCSSRGRCQYYTWFSEQEERFSFYCFLYSDCEIGAALI